MFGRFTHEARTVVARAQQEARELRAAQIEPVHLLLALAGTDGPGRDALHRAGLDHRRLREAAAGDATALDGDALAALGIDLARVRAAADAAFGPGALDDGPASGTSHLSFAAGSRRSLELTLRLVGRRRKRSIDSGCLLHGVLSVDDPVVRRVLARLGTDPDRLRTGAEGDVA